MKKITKLLSALVFCSLVIFISCNKGGGDDNPVETDARDAQAEKLEGTWTVTAAEFDDSQRPDWAGAEVTFDYNYETHKGTYTVTGVPDEGTGVDAVLGAESASVTWEFASETDVNTIERGDGVNMTITSLSDSQLGLSFEITDAGAKVAGFEGKWEFTLEPGS